MAQEQLHDRILRQAFLADPERPALLSTEDVFWKLEEPQLTLAQIRECMDWLVRGGDMLQDRGRYALSPVKFFELKGLFAHVVARGLTVWLAPIAPIRVAGASGAAKEAESSSQAYAAMENGLAELKAVIEKQGDSLSQHSETLSSNSKSLSEHSATLENHAALLSGQSALLDGNIRATEQHAQELQLQSIGLNGFQAALDTNSAKWEDQKAALDKLNATVAEQSEALHAQQEASSKYSNLMDRYSGTLSTQADRLEALAKDVARQNAKEGDNAKAIEKHSLTIEAQSQMLHDCLKVLGEHSDKLAEHAVVLSKHALLTLDHTDSIQKLAAKMETLSMPSSFATQGRIPAGGQENSPIAETAAPTPLAVSLTATQPQPQAAPAPATHSTTSSTPTPSIALPILSGALAAIMLILNLVLFPFGSVASLFNLLLIIGQALLAFSIWRVQWSSANRLEVHK